MRVKYSRGQRTVNFLSKETIAAIIEAERKAESIRAEAAKRRAQMLADEQKKGEEYLSRVEAETAAEINANFAKLDEATKKLLEKNTAEAEMEARDIKNHAKLKLRAGINEIFRGLDRQCQ